MAFLMMPEAAFMIADGDSIPQNYAEVMSHPDKDEWLLAVAKETQALEDMRCFGPPVDLPSEFQSYWHFIPVCSKS
jgi:hypothetical protein